MRKKKEMEFQQDNTIQKIKLLYLMEQMEIPLTENNLIDICTSRNNWLTYLDLKEAMIELLEVGFIVEMPVENEESRYSITLDGRSCLGHFYFRIPKDTRDQIISYTQENRMNYKKIQEYVSEYSKNKDGTYTVTFKIKESMLAGSFNSLLEVKLKTPTRHSAVEASKKWTDKAPKVYEYIYDNFLDS